MSNVVEEKGLEYWLNKTVILWVKEPNFQNPKPKKGIIISCDTTHLNLMFVEGKLTGKIKSFLRYDIHRIDPDPDEGNNVRGDQNK